MRKMASLRALCGLVVAAQVAMGCGGRSPKSAEGGAGKSAEESKADAARAAPEDSGGAREESGRWKRVRVASVDLEPQGGRHILVVKAVPPALGWKVEIRPIPASSSTEREFEVVGLAPAGPARQGARPEIVRAIVEIDARVEQVVVHDNDDATVIPAR